MKYSLVQVDFLDHCIGHPSFADPIPCSVFGLLIYEDEICYKVMHWGADRDVNGENTEVYTVLKKVVLSMVRHSDVCWP